MKFVFLLLVFNIIYFQFCFSQNKIPLNHTVYDRWKDIDNSMISDNGKWVSYEINPQKGDGLLYLFNCESGKKDSVFRGYGAKFSANSDYLIFKIKAPEDTIRKAKIAKKKDDDLPKDSLGIWLFNVDSIIKLPKLKSFKIAKDNSSLITYCLDKDAFKKDSIAVKDTSVTTDSLKIKVIPKEKKKKKDKKKKSESGLFFIFNPVTLKSYQYKDVADFSISNNGSLICFNTIKKDSVFDTTSVFVFEAEKEKDIQIFRTQGTSKKLITDDSGNQISFVFSSDTASVKSFSLFYWDKKKQQVQCVVDTINNAIPKAWTVSENFDNYFSKDGLKLFFGTAPKPEKEIKDTIPDDEKVKLDLWNWKDTSIQTCQLVDLEKDQKKSYLAEYFIKDRKTVQLASESMQFATSILKGNGDVGIGYSYRPYGKFVSWITNQFKDVFLIDFKTGKRKNILQKKQSVVNISPNGKYIIWYENNDSIWYIYSVKKDKSYAITKDINVKFWDDENDLPSLPDPYGFAGWSKDDKYVFIYDKYDIWQVDPEKKENPINLTKNFGRENKITFRYIELDKDAQWINTDIPLLLKAFNSITKQEGYYIVKINSQDNLRKLILEDYKFSSLLKAKSSEKLIWKKSNFSTFPDLWISNISFENPKQITNANPQQNMYKWGSTELLKWKESDGKDAVGLLYKPADFDKNKKYPMIVYFYEKNSDQLNQYYAPKPSRSVISFSEYTSNGYVIFIPDINYKTGNPGHDGFNSIMTGTDYVLSLGFIDENKMGLQGQSWGGYQTLYMITHTNRYKVAMAGAAVSNMTSAYGGIRWTSGLSRMMQYEDGQSRMGAALWEKPQKYIENSPLFYADKVQTPILLMNNDNDGSVPWYQGIEFFLALRRLDKPVWLLNYNGDDHNLKRRANCVDLSIRMSQFFNYYLKDAPAPVWLEKGIPAMKKGIEKGYELIDERK